jgi:hypothetical protein
MLIIRILCPETLVLLFSPVPLWKCLHAKRHVTR